MPSDLEDITQQLIDQMKAFTGLEEPANVAKYHFGRPPRYQAYPTIFVLWAGAEVDEEFSTMNRDFTRDFWDIVTVHRSADEDVATKKVYDLIEKVKAAVYGDKSLNNLVETALHIGDVSETTVERNYTIVHALRRFETRRHVA